MVDGHVAQLGWVRINCSCAAALSAALCHPVKGHVRHCACSLCFSAAFFFTTHPHCDSRNDSLSFFFPAPSSSSRQRCSLLILSSGPSSEPASTYKLPIHSDSASSSSSSPSFVFFFVFIAARLVLFGRSHGYFVTGTCFTRPFPLTRILRSLCLLLLPQLEPNQAKSEGAKQAGASGGSTSGGADPSSFSSFN